MDPYTRKKAIGVPGFSVRGGNLAFRDSNSEGGQYCNRLGCATRFNSMNAPQIGRTERPKYSARSFRSTCSKALAVGSSSRSLPSSSASKHAIDEQSERNSLDELSSGESSNNGDEIISIQSSGESDSGLNTASSSVSRKQSKQSIYHTREISLSSSLKRPVTSRSSSSQASKTISHSLRNLGCTSISDVLPDSGNRSRRVDSARKKLYEGETSSSRAKNVISSSSRPSNTANSNLSRLEGSLPSQISRRGRNQPGRSEGAVSVRTRRSNIGDNGMRLSEQSDDHTLSLAEFLQSGSSISEAVFESSSRSVSVELPPAFNEPLGCPTSSSRTHTNRSISRVEDDSSHMLQGPMGERDGYRRLNVETIAEVLLALERIGQNEELSYEQLLVLETNLILGGLSFYDQHRDMRMDIDNMTYEELLALEEKIGAVSTALSEEALVKCLRRSIYMSASRVSGHSRENDGTKCSICQEEYSSGDEVGKLACDHLFHVTCIHHWLRLKNWCPICKASVCSS